MSGATAELAVTGLGVCSPGGVGTEALWNALNTGRAHRPPLTGFDTTGATLRKAGKVPGTAGGGDGRWRVLDLAEQAAAEALAGMPEELRKNTAVVLGTTDPGEVPSANGRFAGELAGASAGRLGLAGEAITVASASASGAVAVAVGRDLVAVGDAPAALVGGADAVTETAFWGLNSLRTLGPHGCRPFSAERRGIGVSEGAALLRLEPLDQAVARGAPVKAVLAGCGLTNATDHLAAPRAEGIELAVRRALADAELDPGQIDLINAHGPGTRQGDRTEIAALRTVFGARLREVPVVSVKGVLWHLQGGAGAVEALACVLFLHHRMVSPTWASDPVDPSYLDLDLVTEERPRAVPGLRTALTVSCGLGGMNTALVFRSL